MTATRHVVLDLGGVVLRWEPEIPYRRLIPEPEQRARFLSEVCNAAWIRLTDLGGSWEAAENDLIARFPDEAALIRAFRRHWHEMVPETVAGTPDILATLLTDGHDVTALTNFAPDTFAETIARFPLLDTFRGATVSGRVGLVKPDEAIFRRHVRDFGLEPGATLFFDDSAANVAAARRVGWRAELFSDARSMLSDLRRYGIDLR